MRSTYLDDVVWSCSRPSCKVFRDLEISASWVFGSRFSDMALWRSSRDSLTWSASSKSCDKLAIVAILIVWFSALSFRLPRYLAGKVPKIRGKE